MNKINNIHKKKYTFSAVAYARVNLIGEHTDYTGGYVMPTLIPFKTKIYISTNKKNYLIHSNLFKKQINFKIIKKQRNFHWSNYIRGCLSIIYDNFNVKKEYLNIYIVSNIPINKGISSSAALCVAMIKVLNKFYKLKINKNDIALMAQRVEKEYIGLSGGIMDQMVCCLGSIKKAFFLDCHTLKNEIINIPSNFIFYIIDSNTQRKLRESSYNSRFNEIKKAEKILKCNFLAEVSMKRFNKTIFNNLKIKKRAKHVISENQRVLRAKLALKNKDINEYGSLMNASHNSYSNDFEASNKKINEIVSISLKFGAVGSRLTGGGFGGFVVSLVSKKNSKNWEKNMYEFYNKTIFYKIT